MLILKRNKRFNKNKITKLIWWRWRKKRIIIFAVISNSKTSSDGEHRRSRLESSIFQVNILDRRISTRWSRMFTKRFIYPKFKQLYRNGITTFIRIRQGDCNQNRQSNHQRIIKMIFLWNRQEYMFSIPLIN